MGLKFSTRRRVLGLVLALIFISLLSSGLNLYRTSEVNRLINGMNSVSVPLGRHLVQMQVDSEVFLREVEKGLGQTHWKDSHWTPRLAPKWILEVVQKETDKIFEFLRIKAEWTDEESKNRWTQWAEDLSRSLHLVISKSFALYSSLEKKDFDGASEIYPEWSSSLGNWKRTLQTGSADYEQSLRKSFQIANSKIESLKDGLEIILFIVVLLSLSLLWLSERALRPLQDLTQLARDIARRGLRKDDKAQLNLSLNRTDEVSQLAREFHSMATSLLEREKTVESQNDRLTEQNRQLREMGALQERLRAAENLAAIGRMSAQVAHEVRNPLHSIGLEAEIALDLAAKQGNINLKQSVQSILNSVDRLQNITENYLKLSRLSSGQKRQVDMGEILESVLATYASMCEAQNVRVEWHRLPNSNHKVYGDPALLEQALGNLLKNSLQALQESESEKRIDWTLGQMESGNVWIKIQDNGPGIPIEIRPRLFTPFMTTKAQGTGLGLSFIKQVMDDHSSTIRYVDAEQGASFEILMPSCDSIPVSAEKLSEVNIHV